MEKWRHKFQRLYFDPIEESLWDQLIMIIISSIGHHQFNWSSSVQLIIIISSTDHHHYQLVWWWFCNRIQIGPLKLIFLYLGVRRCLHFSDLLSYFIFKNGLNRSITRDTNVVFVFDRKGVSCVLFSNPPWTSLTLLVSDILSVRQI